MSSTIVDHAAILAFFLFRTRKLKTASNYLLMSLTLADFLLLLNCYTVVIQSVGGGPILGYYGEIIKGCIIIEVSDTPSRYFSAIQSF